MERRSTTRVISRSGRTTTLGPRLGTLSSHVRHDCPLHCSTMLTYVSTVDDNTSHGFIHKSKQSNSGSFSIGKTWKLEDLRALEVLDVRRHVLLPLVGHNPTVPSVNKLQDHPLPFIPMADGGASRTDHLPQRCCPTLPSTEWKHTSQSHWHQCFIWELAW